MVITMIDFLSSIYINLRNVKRQIFLYVIEIVVVFVLLSTLLVIYNTFGALQPPIKLHEPAIVNIISLKNSNSEVIGYDVGISRDITYKTITTYRDGKVREPVWRSS